MSLFSLAGGAVLALALQTSGSAPAVQTDADSVAQTCIGLATPDTSGMTDKQWKAFIGCIFRETAAQIDSQLPIRIDDTWTLVAISANGAQLNYTYVMNGAASDLSPSAGANIAKAARRNVCADTDMAATIGRGGSYFYRWLDRSGGVIQTALIDAC